MKEADVDSPKGSAQRHHRRHDRPPMAASRPRGHSEAHAHTGCRPNLEAAAANETTSSEVQQEMGQITDTLKPFLVPASLAELAFTTFLSDLSNVSESYG